MRGRNTRTAGHRVFLFYCEEWDLNLCLGYRRKRRSISLPSSFTLFDCRDRRPRRSNVASVTNCIFVYCQNKDNIRKQYIYLLFKDRRDAGPYKFDVILFYRQQTDVRRWRLLRREPWERSPRVSSSHFNKSAVCYVAIFTNIPNYRREYRYKLRTNPWPPPIQVLCATFSERKWQKHYFN